MNHYIRRIKTLSFKKKMKFLHIFFFYHLTSTLYTVGLGTQEKPIVTRNHFPAAQHQPTVQLGFRVQRDKR